MFEFKSEEFINSEEINEKYKNFKEKLKIIIQPLFKRNNKND